MIDDAMHNLGHHIKIDMNSLMFWYAWVCFIQIHDVTNRLSDFSQQMSHDFFRNLNVNFSKEKALFSTKICIPLIKDQ